MKSNNFSKKINPFVIITAFIAALGGFTLGFDAGFAIDGKDQITTQFNLSDFEWSFIACCSIIGSIVAIPISGRFVDKLGAKKILQLAAFVFMLGLGLAVSATHLVQLTIGRFIIGICIGIASFVSPLFISEISPSSIRGGMILFNGIAITTGQALSFLIAYYIHDISLVSWRMILGIEILPALALFVGMFFMPQSPRWLAKQSGIEIASEVLKKIRPYDMKALENELNEIKVSIASDIPNVSFKYLFSKKIFPVLMVGTCLGIFQQFVGISAIMYYGPVVFQAVGFNTVREGIFATFCISLINVILTIVSAFLIDNLGRRLFLLYGTLIAGISMLFLGMTCQGKFSEQWGLFFVAAYIIGYCVSLGSLFWVLVSEIFPTYIRGRAMSFVTAFQCIANLLVSITFLVFFNHIGTANTFFLYGLMSFISFIFIYYFVPETRGVTLEVIENNLKMGKKIRQLGLH